MSFEECHYIVAVDGKATDIRGTAELAVRQGKVQKDRNQAGTVTIHYGPASGKTRYVDGRLVVDISATLTEQTILATIK